MNEAQTIIKPKAGRQIAVVSVDLSLHRADEATTFFGPLGQGQATDTALSRLRREADAVKKDFPDATMVWMIHFHPFALKNKSLELLLNDDFRSAVDYYRIPLVLSGHTHIVDERLQMNTDASVVDQTLYLTVNSAMAVNNNGSNSVFMIDMDLPTAKGASVAISVRELKWTRQGYYKATSHIVRHVQRS